LKSTKILLLLLWVQGIYFTLTGIWPFIHLKSFLWVTGPKNDIWLLKTVAGLITAIGLTFLVSAYRREFTAAVITLALGSAFCLMAIDIYYATNDVIWDVYLLDAIAEAILIIAWTIGLSKAK
jgi:hypothetical protein